VNGTSECEYFPINKNSFVLLINHTIDVWTYRCAKSISIWNTFLDILHIIFVSTGFPVRKERGRHKTGDLLIGRYNKIIDLESGGTYLLYSLFLGSREV
jgi:hypothetical protein